MLPIAIYLLTVNVLLFLLMHIDKKRAIQKRWRIPEGILFGIAAIGGSLGGILGMHAFRHKTRHLRFRSGFPLILTLQLAFALLIVVKFYF